MGMNKYTHIGIYVKIPKIKKAVTRNVLVDTFGNETNNKFDPNTGKENFLKPITEDKVNSPTPYPNCDASELVWEIGGFSEDAFYEGEGLSTKTHEIFLCNDMNLGFDEYDVDISFKGLNVLSDLENFKKKYKLLIEFWEEEYGSVIIDYGAVNYWS